ncbi:ATP-binding protein [Bacillus benzoevorans]|uniref:DNA replication protein DnaC n=2 Tax=Bacillus benzoevorans TaxID=1456 RepID=A0A7X0LXW0_9BACI|nr:ATP-binding protein [Bacillus benzoevorans]MBB6448045.1 DNA replication protein DnaC [Bacillus benzoevorans]
MSLLNEETRRKLRELNLNEMIEAIDEQAQDIGYSTISFEDRMKMAIDFVYQKKYNSKVERLIKAAKFRIANASFNDIYYIDRGLDKEKLLSLSTAQFIDTHSSVIFHGFTGSGKSYLACALGKQACIHGIKTRYIRIPDLLMLRDEATLVPQGISKLLRKFTNYKLLIFDEWLLDDLTEEEQHFLFELIERRHDNSSTIFCTQFKKEDWHARLGGGVHADAMMDRIVHNAAWMFTGNLNMRQLYAKKQN